MIECDCLQYLTKSEKEILKKIWKFSKWIKWHWYLIEIELVSIKLLMRSEKSELDLLGKIVHLFLQTLDKERTNYQKDRKTKNKPQHKWNYKTNYNIFT